ncbi:hypothetical protein IV203_014834 [Nitzschia inconspicua]|uniref:Uncharacterized protein n=1 Tax=Nitzschia inconspicua TaxID=303405 RepID=A0A9K3L9Y9_9STRA|nr:hypothetical protein IV203_014834 [Nitzschia inconspicua]
MKSLEVMAATPPPPTRTSRRKLVIRFSISTAAIHTIVVTCIASSSPKGPDMPAGSAPTFPAATGVTELDKDLNNATVMIDDLIENHIENHELESHEDADEEK